MALTEVNSSSILDGAIKNADINASAAIDGSKISPVFTSNTTIQNTHPKLFLTDTNNNNDFSIENANGLFKIVDQTNSNELFSTNGTVIASKVNHDFSAGIDVNGDITGTGDLTLTSTDTGASASPIIDLYRNNASPSDADYLGQIKFSGESDDNSKKVYAKITGKIDDASSGTEDGIIEITHRKDGTNNISARFTSEDLKLINGTGLEVAGDTTLSGDLTINSTRPRITLNDTDSESDFEIKNENGSFRIRDIDNPTDRYKINSSGTIHEFLGSASFSSTLNVVSNITVGGTVDGVDIAARNTLFGGLTSTSGVLTNGVTATTQSAGDNSTKVATTAYTDTAITNLIDSSPTALNTLNELAAALGDDANFSTTVTNSIATKLPLAGGTLTGNLTISRANPRIIFTDTDNNPDYLIDVNAGHFLIYDSTNSANRLLINSDGHIDLLGNVDISNGLDVTGNITVTGTVDGRDVATDGTKLDTIETNATADQTASEILTLLKTVDGAGSGLDADTLDGISSASFLRSDAADTASENITINNVEVGSWSGGTQYKGIFHSSQDNSEYMIINNDGHTFISATSGFNVYIRPGGNSSSNQLIVGTSGTTIGGNSVLTSASSLNASNLGSGTIPSARLSASDLLTLIKTVDGASSGLDADTLDGVSSASFLRSDADDTLNGQYTISDGSNEKLVLAGSSNPLIRWQEGTTNRAYIQWNASSNFLGIYNQEDSSSIRLKDVLDFSTDGINYHAIWHSGNDGAGSGLDADTVDGLQASSFLRSDANDSTSGILTLTSSSQYPLVINGADNGKILLQGSSSPYIKIREGTTDKVLIQWQANGYLRIKNHEDNSVLQIKDNLTFSTDGETTNHTIWHAGNDGAGSGLDADTLDGQQGSYYTNAANLTGTLPAIDGSNLTGISAGATGGGSDECFVETDQSVTTSYTLSSNKNAVTISPEINSGVTITVPSGATLVIL